MYISISIIYQENNRLEGKAMFLNFNVKKEKDLIILNYYIIQNVEDSKVKLSASTVAEALGIDRTKAHRLIRKLEELNIIECLKKASGGRDLSIYKYTNETKSETVNETVSICKNKEFDKNDEMVDEAINETKDTVELNQYGNMYKSIYKRSSKAQLIKLQEIKGIEKIEISLFEYIAKVVKDDDAVKSKYKYFTKCIENAIKDNITSIDKYKEDQNNRRKINERNVVEYMEHPKEEDFELLAMLSRER